MKTLLFSIALVLFISGCTKDVKSYSRAECKEIGFKFVEKTRLNYRTGKYEKETMCLNNRS